MKESGETRFEHEVFYLGTREDFEDSLGANFINLAKTDRFRYSELHSSFYVNFDASCREELGIEDIEKSHIAFHTKGTVQPHLQTHIAEDEGQTDAETLELLMLYYTALGSPKWSKQAYNFLSEYAMLGLIYIENAPLGEEEDAIDWRSKGVDVAVEIFAEEIEEEASFPHVIPIKWSLYEDYSLDINSLVPPLTVNILNVQPEDLP